LKVKKEKLFLRNQRLEINPSNQKKSLLYKRVRDHIKNTGYIINPLLVIRHEDKYKVVYGNNRYLAGLELGFKEFDVEVLQNDNIDTIKQAAKKYKEVKL
jgi:ParB-like chromosome segregation protein Spo0J